jgi:2-polyprenyl-6-methoxyphenol hydroxylase-like FAD-dependent oxidoreductase
MQGFLYLLSSFPITCLISLEHLFDENMKVLVVGAGITGLSAAVFLEKKGIEVKLIEKSDKETHLGYVVALYPNSTPLLKELGVFDEVKSKAVPLKTYKLRDNKNRHLLNLNFAKFHKKDQLEGLIVERGVLHSSLVKKYGAKKISWQTEVRDIVEKETHLEVTFKDGKKEDFDFVVGADGIYSTIRSHYFLNDEIKSYHAYVWISWLDKDIVPPKTVEEHIGDNSTFLFMPVEDKCAVYLVVMSKDGNDFVDERLLDKHFVDYDKRTKRIVESVAKAKGVYKTALRHIETYEWNRGRIVLIGDAVHAMSPLTALGCTLALQDAYVLAEELSQGDKDYRKTMLRFHQRRSKVIVKAKRLTRYVMEAALKFSDHTFYRHLHTITAIFSPIIKLVFEKYIADFIKTKI